MGVMWKAFAAQQTSFLNCLASLSEGLSACQAGDWSTARQAIPRLVHLLFSLPIRGCYPRNSAALPCIIV